MTRRPPKQKAPLDQIIDAATRWIGSTASLLAHTAFFIVCFVLVFAGVPLDRVLLVLTTVVSLEAIYLAIFIQMTVNRASDSIAEIEEDVDEIQEDIDEIEKDVDEIQKDIDEIEEDIDDIEKDEEEQKQRDVADAASLRAIENKLAAIVADLERIRKN